MIWIPLSHLPCEINRPTPNHPNSRYLTFAPTQAAAQTSGDRQRREKGPPILTAEKGEFGARRIAGEIWPIMLRAT